MIELDDKGLLIQLFHRQMVEAMIRCGITEDKIKEIDIVAQGIAISDYERFKKEMEPEE